MRRLPVLSLLPLAVLAGCRAHPASPIVRTYQQGGGTEGVNSSVIPTSFLADHPDLRKQLNPLCHAEKVSLEWLSTPEVRICVASDNANAFAPVTIKSEGVKF